MRVSKAGSSYQYVTLETQINADQRRFNLIFA